MSSHHGRDRELQKIEQRLKQIDTDRRRLLKGTAATVGALAIGAWPGSGPLRTAAVAAAQDTASGAAEPSGEQLFYNFVLQNDPSSFDFNVNLYANAEPEVWSGLLTFNPDGQAIADWAERWEKNEDGSVWTFYIRPGNNGWSNGEPITAADFIYSFTRLLDPNPAGAPTQNSYSFILYDILHAESFSTGTPVEREGDPLNGQVATEEDLGMRALDEWTLEITLEGPRANFEQKVAYLACVPAHRPSVEEFGEEWALGDIPLVSSGPFKLDLWEKGVKAVISPNPNHWQFEQIRLTKVVDPIVPASSSVFAFEQGEGDQQLDWTPVGAADLPRFQSDPVLSTLLHQYVYPGLWMLLPSNGVPPFDDLAVRRAVSHAIDRERLVTVTNGLVIPAQAMTPIGVYGYLDQGEYPEIYDIQRFDPELAMSLLEGTEYAGGQNWPEITVLIRGEEEVYNSDIMLNDIIDQLRQNLNMPIRIEKLTGEASFRPRLLENRDQLVWIRWWFDYPDPDNGYYDMFYGAKPPGFKRQAWSNLDFDRIVLSAKEELDPAARLDLYAEAERIIQEDVGYIPIAYRVDQYAFKPFVQNLPTNSQGYTVPDTNIYLRMLTQIYLTGRPAG